MTRNKLIAVVGAAALLLAGCGSKSTTASSSSSAAASAAVPSASSSAMASAPESSAAASRAPASSAPESGAPESGAPDSSAPESSAPESSAPESGAPESGAPESSAPAGSGAASSVSAPASGGGAGSLDAASTAWFGAFCGGLTPFFVNLKSVKAKQSGIATTDLAGQQKLLADFLESGGAQLNDLAGKLKPLPAPGFTGGTDFATKEVAFFEQAGPAFVASGKKLAAATPDKAGIAAAASDFGSQLLGVSGQISAVGSLSIPDSTKNALLQVPACVTLQSSVSG